MMHLKLELYQTLIKDRFSASQNKRCTNNQLMRCVETVPIHDVCLSVHRCICVQKKNQLDATECFTALIICSTCFRYFYAHHQELEAICVLLPPMVCDALVAGCRRLGAGQPAMRSRCGMLLDSSPATSLIPNA